MNEEESESASSDNEMERKVKATYVTSLPTLLIGKDITHLIIGPPYFRMADHTIAKLGLVQFHSHLTKSHGALLR